MSADGVIQVIDHVMVWAIVIFIALVGLGAFDKD